MENYNAISFVEENMKTIFAYSLSRVSNHHDAEDLASEIILAILQNSAKIKDSNAFYGFVWGIAANTYKNFMRKRYKIDNESIPENLSSDDDFVAELCAREDINLLRRELSLLSSEYRECTVAYYIDGLSCSQTAQKLGISLEMVKYYLFKTRKLLKEGIGMEREYGEKSYNPAKFEFVTIFTGEFNREYRNLFNRKLPGNIMLSTYYTPMNIRELSLELGVAAPYLEDEVALLEKYGLLCKQNNGKYQTNLVVFTEAFSNEFYKHSQKECVSKLTTILRNAKTKLEDIRKIGFIGEQLDDNRLLWSFLWMIMRSGYSKFEQSNSAYSKKNILYNGATGINYGVDYDDTAIDKNYSCDAFAGYARIDEVYALSFADFGVIPEQNRYCLNSMIYKDLLYKALEKPANAKFPILKTSDINAIERIFASEINDMAELYVYLNASAVNTMRNHAPVHVKEQIDHIIGSTIFFRTVGFIGGCAFDSNEIFLSDDNEPLALYGYKCEDTDAYKNGRMSK